MFSFIIKGTCSSLNGVEYSPDGKFLLSTPTNLNSLVLPKGCQVITCGESRIQSSFYNCINTIKKIECELDSELRSIYSYTFHQSSLEYVDLRNCGHLAEINCSVFRECFKLVTVLLPDGLTTICAGSFWTCTSLVSIKIPDSITVIKGWEEIHEAAFFHCTKLERIELTEFSRLKEIGTDNFSGSKLSSIYIPKDTYTIASALFGSKVSSIEIHPNNTHFIFKDGMLLDSTGTNIKYVSFTTADEFIVPNYINKIDYSAFRKNSMKRVTFEGPITSFGTMIFDLSKLEYFEFPEGGFNKVTERMFGNCNNLVSVKLSPSITTIEKNAFANCTSLTEINIDEGITTIHDRAFFGCESLKLFKCPKSVETIEQCVFSGCCELSFDLNGNTHLSLERGVLYSKNFEYALAYFGSEKEVETVPNCTRIAEYCFYRTKITKITIKSTSIVFYEGAFSESSLESIEIPEITQTIALYSFMNITTLKNVIISANAPIPRIPYCCFAKCTNLATVELSNNVLSIDDFAFDGCTSLTTINLEATRIASIGREAFAHCKFTAINIPSTVENIKDNCFSYCPIQSINLKENANLLTIIQGTFSHCSELHEVTFSDNTKIINGLSFYYCTSLTSVVFPQHITEIRPRAFEKCTSLSQIEFKLNCDLDKISGQSFKGCKSLCHLIVPQDDERFISVDEILYDKNQTILKLFLPGSPLSIFVLPSSVETIGNYAFQDCVNIKSIAIPEGKVKEVGFRSFDGCTSLSSLWLPPTVTVFGKEAFINCPNLKCGSVVYNHGDKKLPISVGIPEIAFETNCPTVNNSNCSNLRPYVRISSLLFTLLLL